MHTDIPNHDLDADEKKATSRSPSSLGAWAPMDAIGEKNLHGMWCSVRCPTTAAALGQRVSSRRATGDVISRRRTPDQIVGKDFDPKKLVSFIHNQAFTLPEQRREIDLLTTLDKLQRGSTPADPQLEAAISAMETAYRMQTEAPDVFDIRKETQATLELYGPGSTARGCLMAVRLVQRGVRMVQVYYAKGDPWDAHSDIQQHRRTRRNPTSLRP